MSKRSLPLAVMALLLAGLASAAEIPAPKPRCAGMAQLETLLAQKAINLPATAAGKWEGQEHCEMGFWLYLAKNSPQKAAAFNTLSGKMQLDLIKQYAGELEALDKAAAEASAKLAAFKEAAAGYEKASAGDRVKALRTIIVKEGKDLIVNGPDPQGAVQGGTLFEEFNAALAGAFKTPIAVRHGAVVTNEKNIGAPDMHKFHAESSKGVIVGAMSKVDVRVGRDMYKAWAEARKTLNEFNAKIKASFGTVDKEEIALKGAAAYDEKNEKVKKGEAPKPELAAGTALKLDDFKTKFQESTAAELFDNIKRRAALDPSDPEHLSPERAEELKKKYEGGAAEVRDNKIVYTVPGKEKGKRDVVAGTETPLPTELTETAAQDLGKKVAGSILAGDPASAKRDAIMGAVLGDSVGAEGKTGPVGNLTGPQAGPKGFMDEAAAASCGSPLDLGKSKAELAMEARQEAISGKKAANSAARSKLRGECEGKAKDIDGWLEKEQAGIRSRHQTFRSNPSLNGEQIKADVAAEKSELAEAEKAHAERIAKLQADCEEKLKKVGYKSDVEKATSEEEKALADEVRKGYMEPAKGVPAKVEAAKAGYKKNKKALAEAMTEAGVAGSDIENPYKPQWILDDQLYGENGYFTTQWDKEPAKTESYKKMLAKLGVPAEGAIDNNKLKDVSEVPELLEADLVAWYKAYVQKARSSRGGAVTPPKPGEQPAKPGEKAKLKVDFDR